MPPLVVLAGAVACLAQPLNMKQAEALVLAAPNIRAATIERGARPFFERADAGSGGWSFDVKARNPCVGAGPCSKLLGHYAVGRRDGAVVDLDAGEDGKVISSPRITKLRARFLHPSGC